MNLQVSHLALLYWRTTSMRQRVNSAIALNQPTYGLLVAQLPGETEEREIYRQIDVRESKITEEEGATSV